MCAKLVGGWPEPSRRGHKCMMRSVRGTAPTRVAQQARAVRRIGGSTGYHGLVMGEHEVRNRTSSKELLLSHELLQPDKA